MTNLIPSKDISNRKLILEVRYSPNVKYFSIQADLLNKLTLSKIIPENQWSINQGNISISNSLEETEIIKKISIDSKKFHFVYIYPETNERFWNEFEKGFNLFLDCIEKVEFVRIGCRVVGTYLCKYKDYQEIRSKFINMLSFQHLISEFTIKDLMYQLIHEQGSFKIGPINKEDDFVKSQFINSTLKVNEIGFGIDSDVFSLSNETNREKQKQIIKNVFSSSLEVEHNIFDKINQFIS